MSRKSESSAAAFGRENTRQLNTRLCRYRTPTRPTAGSPFSWVTADEVYGSNPKLRAWLEQRAIPYVMAVKCSEMITTAAGARRADELAALVPRDEWQRLSCADGSKGPASTTGRSRH
jgi:hypothetical protein